MHQRNVRCVLLAISLSRSVRRLPQGSNGAGWNRTNQREELPLLLTISSWESNPEHPPRDHGIEPCTFLSHQVNESGGIRTLFWRGTSDQVNVKNPSSGRPAVPTTPPTQSTPPGNRTLPVGFGNRLASLGTWVRKWKPRNHLLIFRHFGPYSTFRRGDTA